MMSRPYTKTVRNKEHKAKKEKTMTWRRKKCVELAKKLAKHRDKFTCQRCSKVVSGINCQGSHVIPESKNKVLSCDPMNIKVLCYRCHKDRRHLHPTESGQWFKDTFPERWAYLHEKNKLNGGTVGVDYFKGEHERLKLLAASLGIEVK